MGNTLGSPKKYDPPSECNSGIWVHLSAFLVERFPAALRQFMERQQLGGGNSDNEIIEFLNRPPDVTQAFRPIDIRSLPVDWGE